MLVWEALYQLSHLPRSWVAALLSLEVKATMERAQETCIDKKDSAPFSPKTPSLPTIRVDCGRAALTGVLSPSRESVPP